jgi:hypothetical protein
MPLVFVHGVANRMSDAFNAGVATRDALFRRFVLRDHVRGDGARVSVSSPYWGDLGARLRWGGASLPLEDFESLGADDAPYLALHASAQPAGKVESADRAVLDVARRSLPDAVDLLWSSAALVESGEAEALATLAAPARAYAVVHSSPEWLDEVSNDQEMLTRLQLEMETQEPAVGGPGESQEWESLGIADAWSALRRGAGKLKNAVTNVVGREASERIRPVAIPSIANFLGDVFVYLHQQGDAAGPIRELIADEIRAAGKLREPADPLVLVAHSMGGNISYDLLTDELRDVPIDLYVTAETQVGFFEELKLFRTSDHSIPGDDLNRKVPRPANISRWINIFDYSDLLGFEVGSIIGDVEDFKYETGSSSVAVTVEPSAH